MSKKMYLEDKKEVRSTGDSNKIREVFSDNFEEEMKQIETLIEKYPCISMDTEFPGIVATNYYVGAFSSKTQSVSEENYAQIKQNVDMLKIIQLGISLSDSEGRSPPGTSTWQFNFNFDIKKDKYNPESITLLINSGINFEVLREKGISPQTFGERFLTSGLVLNEEVEWITFHGSYDFAYLLKVLSGTTLPQRLESFMADLDLYFKNFYDIKYLLKDNFSNYKLSLNKLANHLDVERTGIQHQAGSDSMVTCNVYAKAKRLVLNFYALIDGKNKLYSLSDDCVEDEAFTSFKSETQTEVSIPTQKSITMLNTSYNSFPYSMSSMNIVGYPSYENNYMYSGVNYDMPNVNSMNSMENYHQKLYNMMISSQNQLKTTSNYAIPTLSNFNSGSSTASGSSFTQQIAKKKKSKKEKKKKAQKIGAVATSNTDVAA